MHSLPSSLIPACGGLETPFTVNGVSWLYCWQPSTNRHCYLNLEAQEIYWDRSFHPASKDCVSETVQPTRFGMVTSAYF